MIDWWNLQPRWMKRIRLFLSIVWRPYEDFRIDVRTAWDVALAMHPYRSDNEID